MSYRDTYEKWLNSPALSEAEKAELVWDFKCSLYDDLLIHLEDVFERVK